MLTLSVPKCFSRQSQCFSTFVVSSLLMGSIFHVHMYFYFQCHIVIFGKNMIKAKAGLFLTK